MTRSKKSRPARPYEDLQHEGNSESHRTGKPCVERGCGQPAGTAWSPLWCPACNIVRMNRIDASMRSLAGRGRPQTALEALAALIRKNGGSVRVPSVGVGMSPDATGADAPQKDTGT